MRLHFHLHPVLLALIQLFAVFFTAGVIIGYGQLQPLLVEAGVFNEGCNSTVAPNVTMSPNITLAPNATTAAPDCKSQDSKLGKMFELGATLSIFVQAPGGYILDFIGPKLTGLLGIALLIPGALLFGLAKSDALYNASFQLMAAGGPLIFLSGMPSAELFADKKGTFLTFLNGCYGGGAFVFFFCALLVNHAHVSLRVFFIGYAILIAALGAAVLLFWPLHAPKPEDASPDSSIQISSPLASDSTGLLSGKDNTKWENPMRDIPTYLRNLVVRIFTPTWIWTAILSSFLLVKTNFVLATLNTQLDLINKDNGFYVSFFGVCLPLLGILAGPMGVVIDKFGISAGMVLLLLFSIAESAVSLVDLLWIQIVRFILFSIYFPYLYAVWSTTMSRVFGRNFFGALFGTVALCAGGLNFVSGPILDYTSNTKITSEQSKERFRIVNYVGLFISVVFLIPPIVARLSGYEQRLMDKAKEEHGDEGPVGH